jgi:carboxymethylenebutenolidase
VRDFYGRWFVGRNPDDFTATTLARTADGRRIMDEMAISSTHGIEVPWILPGVAPTGARISVPVVAVVGFEGTLIASEHIYWDQAAVLAQAGLLDRSLVSRLPIVTDQPDVLAHGELNALAKHPPHRRPRVGPGPQRMLCWPGGDPRTPSRVGHPPHRRPRVGPGPQRIKLGPGRLSTVRTTVRPLRGAPVLLEAFFSALLVLVCVGVLAFTALAVKKLYQGQR